MKRCSGGWLTTRPITEHQSVPFTGPDRTQKLVGAISFAAEYKLLRISEQNLEMLLALGFFALLLLFLWPTF